MSSPLENFERDMGITPVNNGLGIARGKLSFEDDVLSFQKTEKESRTKKETSGLNLSENEKNNIHKFLSRTRERAARTQEGTEAYNDIIDALEDPSTSRERLRKLFNILNPYVQE